MKDILLNNKHYSEIVTLMSSKLGLYYIQCCATYYKWDLSHDEVKEIYTHVKPILHEEIKRLESLLPRYELTQRDKHLFTGSQNECYHYLQSCQSQSAEWAMKHEGYKIEPVK